MEYLQRLDPQIINKLRNRLEELQVPYDIDQVEVVASAVIEWLAKTNTGKEYLVQLFGFDWEGGESDKAYYIMDTGDRVRGEDIYFLRTTVVKGRFVPPSCVDACKVDKKGCDECGILSHCTQEVRDQKGNKEDVCNHCLTYSAENSWKEKSGGQKQCDECTVLLCQHRRVRHLVAI